MDTLNAEHLSQLRYLLSSGNVRAALEQLNVQSQLRFTALYRFGPSHAENFMLVDRDDASSPLTDDIPRNETYCSFVEAMADAFVLEDSLADARVANHPARANVMAYCGLPLKTEQGEVFGTLCQFDVEPKAIRPVTVAWMREVAAALGPAAVADAHFNDLEARVDRLSDMQEAIRGAARDGSDVKVMFDSFADPLRAEAARKVSPERHLELEARISAIWWSMTNES